jgi:hypothetical protein
MHECASGSGHGANTRPEHVRAWARWHARPYLHMHNHIMALDARDARQGGLPAPASTCGVMAKGGYSNFVSVLEIFYCSPITERAAPDTSPLLPWAAIVMVAGRPKRPVGAAHDQHIHRTERGAVARRMFPADVASHADRPSSCCSATHPQERPPHRCHPLPC